MIRFSLADLPLPADLVKELTKTAVARKLDRTPPWSQQDIVAEALKQ
jgi:hypothetical protein